MTNNFTDVKVKATHLDKDGYAHVDADSGGGKSTRDYRFLSNKPAINNNVLLGNKSLADLGIQPAGNYANVEDIPTKVSDLQNDANFVDAEYVNEAISHAITDALEGSY